jgi:hypothetical protein
VAQLKAADAKAYNAATAAQTAVDSDPAASSTTTQAALADATAALSAFQSVTSGLPKAQ